METNEKKLSMKGKLSYGLGAVGKDMVYMLSASYVLYYYQDLLHIDAVAMGIILLIARVFDAFNDPGENSDHGYSPVRFLMRSFFMHCLPHLLP